MPEEGKCLYHYKGHRLPLATTISHLGAILTQEEAVRQACAGRYSSEIAFYIIAVCVFQHPPRSKVLQTGFFHQDKNRNRCSIRIQPGIQNAKLLIAGNVRIKSKSVIRVSVFLALKGIRN